MLATATKKRAVWAQRAAWSAVSVLGPRVLTGTRTERPYVSAELWQQWTDALGPFDDLACYLRPQASRAGGLTAVLLRRGLAVAVVKQRADPAPLSREAIALESLARQPLTGVETPRLLGLQLEEPAPWLAQQVLAHRPHRPAWPRDAADLTALAESISARLGGGTHGDLTPWNLRRAGGRVILLDWEDADLAPPGSDETYFRAVCAAAGVGPSWARVSSGHAEAAQWWLGRVAARSASDSDAALSRALLAVLQRWS